MKRAWSLALASLLSTWQVAGAAAAPAVEDLQAESVSNELGLELNEHAFSWKADGQSAYRILVASEERKLAAEVGDLWDSGRRESTKQSGVLCGGRAFADGDPIWWKVMVWNGTGEASTWSAAQKIEVAKQGAAGKAVRRTSGSEGGKLEFVEGRLGKALRLGGSGPAVWAEDYEGLRPSRATTIMAWIKPEKTGDEWQSIIRKEDGNDRRILAIGEDGDVWGLWCGFGIGGKYVEFGAPYDRNKLADGKWHHAAVTFDGTHLRLFVDGERIGEQKSPGALGGNGNARAYIGSHGGERERFEGAIDDLQIYDAALTSEQIGAIANGGGSNGVPDAKVAHWKFDGSIDNEATFAPKVARNRLVLVGGTLISRMDKYGFFETAVTARWPFHDISFRNLGWPADDVFGTARSEFGSAHNTRSWQPPKGTRGFGFEKLKRQLGDADPSTIVVGYGAEAAFADTAEKMEQFEAGYRGLIEELEKTGAKLILLTPIAQAKHGKLLPDPSARNARLARAAKFILALAKVRGHGSVDLLKAAKLPEGDYENGVHLAESGYRRLAAALAGELDVQAGGASLAMSEGVVSTAGGVRGELERTKRGVRFDFQVDQLPWPASVENATTTGRLAVTVDGQEATVEESGVVRGGADHEQAEELREAIVEKNKIYRYRLNPINKAYIFLFRRHEMGHLAYEMEDFEEIVEGREQVIANLRVPRTRRYVVERREGWKAPRDYPDHEVPKDIPAPDVAAELKAFKVAEGFKVNLFAQNPMIFNPINLNWDRHGRAWVSTSSTYPHIKPGRIPNDRIVILEDTDRDGVADRHKVFAEGLTVPHSVMPVKGGAYVCSTTEVLFLGDADGDDVADSRRVIFSGFGNADVHHMIHGLRWSPWGDLFFTQSIYINSFVDTLHGPRRLNGSGIWRFRPESERLEVYSRGMVNPWGLAFDYWGRGFGTDGAGGSGPHDVFPGSAFGTAVGAPRVLGGLIRGKPKNTGAEFMTGRHIPSHWQGSMLGNDFRANRTVRYELKEKGSGFTASEVETVLHSSHRSFRPVDIKMGPDGAIYVVDWYNPIIDHGEVDFHHPLRDKSHGRIWRITAIDRPLVDRPVIAEASVEELLDHLKAPEQYTRTQANRELVRRGISRSAVDTWLAELDPGDTNYDHDRLEALWLYTALNEKSAESLLQLQTVADPRIRGAAAEVFGRTEAGLAQLARAVEDEHPRVRLAAVCALRELGSLEAANIALRALDHDVDGNLDFAIEMTVRDTRDQWLPAMQSGKKVFDGDAGKLSYALKKVNDPRAIEALAEVVKKGELKGEDLSNAVATVAALGEAARIGDMLELARKSPELVVAIARGAEFNPAVPETGSQAAAHLAAAHLAAENGAVRAAAAELIGRWKVKDTVELLAKQAGAATSSSERLAMTTALARLGASDALEKLWGDGNPAGVRAAAIAAQASLDPAAAAVPAAQILRGLSEADDARIVFEGFLARENGPALLATMVAAIKLPEEVALAGSRAAAASGREVSQLTAALNKAGGLKPVSQNLSPDERRLLIADATAKGSPSRGRVVYERTALVCTTCHLVNGKGGKLGPDLSTLGTYMTPESILESLLNPSTDIKQGFETVVVTRKDKTLVSGLLQRKTDNAVLVRDPTGKVVSIPSGDVAKVDTSPVSLMPPGLTATLRRDELVDLMSYLTNLGK